MSDDHKEKGPAAGKQQGPIVHNNNTPIAASGQGRSGAANGPFDYIANRLRNGMREGQMHACLRDNGRHAGGLAASNDLSGNELAELEQLAKQLAKDPQLARNKWQDAVAYGKKEPCRWETSATHAPRKGGALDWENIELLPPDQQRLPDDPLPETITPEQQQHAPALVPETITPEESAKQIANYLRAVFEPGELVGYVQRTFEKGGRMAPADAGEWRDRDELIALCEAGDLAPIIGQANEVGGAFVRINPLDGGGAKDANVTAYRHVLIESDSTPIEEQESFFRDSQLPITAIVYSGNKSLHAIIRVDARDYDEYTERSAAVYEHCAIAGLPVDPQNKNPSRLSRMPGVPRKGAIQKLLATNPESSWQEWRNTLQQNRHDKLAHPTDIFAKPALEPVPPFDLEMLPQRLRPRVRDVAERMQCPVDYVAIPLVVGLSATLGRRLAMRPRKNDSWEVVPNLWGMVIGSAGMMKTPAAKEALSPLKAMEKQTADENAEKMREFNTQSGFHRNKVKALENRLRKASEGRPPRPKSEVESEEAVREELEKAHSQAPERPPQIRHVVNDATIEALGEILKDNPQGILWYRDELNGLFQIIKSKGHENDRAMLLQTWAGDDDYVWDRIGRGTVIVPATCVSILGGIQPGVIGAIVQQALRPSQGADGFLQRFQMAVWPDAKPDWENIDRKPDGNAEKEIINAFRELNELPYGDTALEWDLSLANRDTRTRLHYLRFESKAQAAFNQWYTDLHQRLAAQKLPEAMNSHLAKYPKLVSALALIFHVVDSPGEQAVAHSAFKRAEAFADYLWAHAKRIYNSGQHAEISSAQRIAAKLLDRTLSGTITARSIYRANWSGLSDKETVANALDYLETEGWLMSQPTQAAGRRTVKYQINPKIFEIR